MTLPDERTRAVKRARLFLRALMNPAVTKKIPGWARREAYSCLRHYPGDLDFLLIGDTEDVRRVFAAPDPRPDGVGLWEEQDTYDNLIMQQQKQGKGSKRR